MVVAIVAAIAAAMAAWPGAAGAHGTLDQTLDGNPFCNAFNFPSSDSQAGGQRQTFTPSEPGLSGIDVCVLDVGAVAQVAIRNSDGDVIGGASEIVTGGGDGFTHINFPAPYVVDVGEPLTIELISAVPIAWHGNGPGGAYPYGGGSSNSGVVEDFAFRSYYAPIPPTLTPTNTIVPTSTRTRTPTPTATRTITATPSPSATAPPALATATTPAGPGDPPTQPPAAGATPRSAAPATPTRTSGVLGARQFTGRIYLPDVGAPAISTTSAHSSRPPLALASILLATVGLFLTRLGARTRAHPPTRRTNTNHPAPS
jgi:hypothetical protein